MLPNYRGRRDEDRPRVPRIRCRIMGLDLDLVARAVGGPRRGGNMEFKSLDPKPRQDKGSLA